MLIVLYVLYTVYIKYTVLLYLHFFLCPMSVYTNTWNLRINSVYVFFFICIIFFIL